MNFVVIFLAGEFTSDFFYHYLDHSVILTPERLTSLSITNDWYFMEINPLLRTIDNTTIGM